LGFLASRSSFFKSPLGLRISLCDHRPRFSATKSHAPKQALTLPHSQWYPVALSQMMGQELSVPKVLTIAQVARVNPQVGFEFFPGFIVQAAGAAFPLAFPQATQAVGLKTVNPAFDGGGMFAKPLANVVAAMALAN
jgi:hypothetical protein